MMVKLFFLKTLANKHIFLPEKNISPVPQPIYFSDQSTCVYFLLRKIKTSFCDYQLGKLMNVQLGLMMNQIKAASFKDFQE